jgi:DNA-binding transcriptional MerR regulator
LKELYSIGETAKLMGISVQTLRNYSNMNLLKPQYIDADTGYRYYSFHQFHYIDRIKYLRKLGIPLSEIEDVLEEGKTDKLIACMEEQEKRIAEEERKIHEIHDDISWYIKYFKYIDLYQFDNIPYVLRLEERYVMAVDYLKDDTVESVETRLAALKNRQELNFRRQYGYIADFGSLMEKQFVPTKYFIYLKDKPAGQEDWLTVLPAGEYLCFRGKIRTDDWSPSIVSAYFREHKHPPYVVANEYEDNLSEYHNCPYEIQMFLSGANLQAAE